MNRHRFENQLKLPLVRFARETAPLSKIFSLEEILPHQNRRLHGSTCSLSRQCRRQSNREN